MHLILICFCNFYISFCDEQTSESDLLEDAQLGKGPGDVQLDQLQTRLSVRRT